MRLHSKLKPSTVTVQLCVFIFSPLVIKMDIMEFVNNITIRPRVYYQTKSVFVFSAHPPQLS